MMSLSIYKHNSTAEKPTSNLSLSISMLRLTPLQPLHVRKRIQTL